MEILIISGMSGAGKSRAAICLEDGVYYIVDDLPAEEHDIRPDAIVSEEQILL